MSLIRTILQKKGAYWVKIHPSRYLFRFVSSSLLLHLLHLGEHPIYILQPCQPCSLALELQHLDCQVSLATAKSGSTLKV